MTFLYTSSFRAATQPDQIQTEYKDMESDDWVDVTRRETIAGAEQAIDSSIEHYSKKLEFLEGPKVVKTFE